MFNLSRIFTTHQITMKSLTVTDLKLITSFSSDILAMNGNTKGVRATKPLSNIKQIILA